MRPENVKNVPPPKTRKTGLLMVCMFIVFGAIFSYAWIGMLSDIMFLRNGVNTLQDKIGDLEVIKAKLTEELARLTKQEGVYVLNLSIMQQELPTIEIFESIDKSIVRGIILNSLVITQKELKLNGVADTEDNISTFMRNLMDSAVFYSVQLPTVARNNMGPEGLKFLLPLEPKPIGESGRR